MVGQNRVLKFLNRSNREQEGRVKCITAWSRIKLDRWIEKKKMRVMTLRFCAK